MRLVERLQRRDQVGLRLHDLRAVDLEQRIAALHLVADLGDQPRDAAGERRQHDGAGVLVECDLADGRLLQMRNEHSSTLTMSSWCIWSAVTCTVSPFFGRGWAEACATSQPTQPPAAAPAAWRRSANRANAHDRPPPMSPRRRGPWSLPVRVTRVASSQSTFRIPIGNRF